jgi:hypothetical protein
MPLDRRSFSHHRERERGIVDGDAGTASCEPCGGGIEKILDLAENSTGPVALNTLDV